MVYLMDTPSKRDIRDSYDILDSGLYDLRYEEEQRAKYQVILTGMGVNECGISLDDGCGTGLLFDSIPGFFVGVDLSSTLLVKALERAKPRDGGHLLQADAENLPFRGRVFNAVYAVTLIQNTPHPKSTLGQITYVSKPSASIAVTALKKAFDLNSFSGLLEEAGLRIQKIIQEDGLSDMVAFSSLS